MHRAEVNLSRNFSVDAACNYDRMSSEKTASSDYGLHSCVLSAKSPYDGVSAEEFGDLLSIGCPIRESYDVSVYKIAMIMDKHFKAGEWGMSPRCGSVITCVINGRSVYARVFKFIKTDGADECPGYACVRWFSEPVYVNSLCPRVTLDGSDIEREVGRRVIRITQIDPSPVHVEVVPGSDEFYMIRDSGYDTRRR